MLKTENVETYGWEAAVRGMRNPMNSWEMSDSAMCPDSNGFEDCRSTNDKCPRTDDDFHMAVFCIGKRDFDLMRRLVRAGTDHSKFMRMIGISMDIVAPLYWWKEYDTYKVGTVSDSCSTMHKIAAKEFSFDDFSIEHLNNRSRYTLGFVVQDLNYFRDRFLETDDKSYWWQMIQLLPSSYNQRRTVMLNYQVARNIYHARKKHKLDEWHELCRVFEALPYSELITMEAQK